MSSSALGGPAKLGELSLGPGPPVAAEQWGASPLLVDTSAWARAHQAAVIGDWQRAPLADRLRISPIVRLEILLSARSGAFDELSERRP